MNVPTYRAKGIIQSKGTEEMSVVIKVVTPSINDDGKNASRSHFALKPHVTSVFCSESFAANFSFSVALAPCFQSNSVDKSMKAISAK